MTALCTRTILTRIQKRTLAALIRLARNNILKACITSGAGQRLLAWFFSRKILTILCDSTDAHPLNVVAFSYERFVQDYQVLGSHSRIRLFTFSFNIVKSILPLFLPTDQGPQRYYYLVDDPRVFAGRERLRLFVRRFIMHIQRQYNLQCAVTPSFHMKKEQEWAAGCHDAGLPFIALHKEMTIVNEDELLKRAEGYKQQKFRFRGTELFVVNKRAKKLLEQAGVCPTRNIHVVGMLRTDLQFKGDRKNFSSGSTAPAATLFSFGHFSGGIFKEGVARRSKLFSLHDDWGFVQLFKDVHAAFAEEALRNPDATFYIKPKNNEAWWINEIRNVVLQQLSLRIEEIPNLSIVDTPAPELINRSSVIIGFNSTVLIEGICLRTNTIMPCFAEALQFPQHVYLKDYFDLFGVAASKEDLQQKIAAGLRNCQAFVSGNTERMRQFLTDYIGNCDGKTCDRVIVQIEECLRQYGTAV
jgi:hypothetical protein